MKYLSDKPYTLDRIKELVDAVEFARYELAAALMVAKPLGMSWAELGERLGMTGQGAGAMARRQMHLQELPDHEYERICRLLGIGDKVPRYVVREIESGRPGVTAVKWRTIGTPHLRQEVAERVARKRGGTAAVFMVAPDGTETRLAIRPERHRRVDADQLAAMREAQEGDEGYYF